MAILQQHNGNNTHPIIVQQKQTTHNEIPINNTIAIDNPIHTITKQLYFLCTEFLYVSHTACLNCPLHTAPALTRVKETQGVFCGVPSHDEYV